MTYTYDHNDRLITEAGPDDTHTYSYDENGNTLGKTDGSETTVYGYDYENRLVLVDTATTDTLYDYDADGIRVSSETNGALTDFLVDKNRDYAQVLEERDTTGAIIVEYIYGDDLISQERGGADYCYLYDGQMSARQLVDENEDVANTYTYDAFGMVIDQAGVVANDYMYTGEQYDPNAGFYYLRARYMNPEIGRFVTTDPYKGSIFEPLTLHKYLYAGMNPIMFVDPSGEMMTIGQCVATVALISDLAYIGYGFYGIMKGDYISGAIDVSLGFMGAGVWAGSVKFIKFAFGPANRLIRLKYLNWLNSRNFSKSLG